MDTDGTKAVGDSAVSDDASFLRFLVVGVDGSGGSRRALRWAAQLAETTGAEILAVHVLTYTHELFRDVTPDTMRTWRRELQDELRSSWVEPLAAGAVPHRTLIVEADSAAGGLLATADREAAD